MSTFVDRRLNPRDKNVKNRQKLIQRSRKQIQNVVRKIVEEGSIQDLDETKIKIKVKGVSEPTFNIDPKTGDRKYVLPGNEEYVVGDTVPKPDDSDGGERGPRGSRHGQGNDDFEFLLSHKEFVDFLFDELELPRMVKKKMKTIRQVTFQKAGFKNYGTPNQLDIVRSLKNSLGRRIGLKRPTNEEIEKLKLFMNYDDCLSNEEREELRLKIEEMERRQIVIPWIDPFDIKYRAYVPQPKPITQAVMFCLMDVSASMGEREKDMAKRFFFLLHQFLKRKYEKIDVVFIAHHSEAMEVNEHEFFYGTETGGTVVSTSLALTNKILGGRYKKDDWNVYVAHCSDGGNTSDDDEDTTRELNRLLPCTQYFAYLEVSTLTTFNYGIVTDLYKTYKNASSQYEQMKLKLVYDKSQVWKVFRELFAKENA